MKLEKLDLNLLKVFEVIYRERNLTRASEALNITQPAVSNALRRLRESLGNPLFTTTPKGVAPTPEADLLIGKVREALNLLNAAINDIAHFEPQESTRAFRFSMSDFAEAIILPPLMEILRREAPYMSVNSHYIGRDNAERELGAGQLDFVVDTPLPAPHNLHSVSLISEPYVCAMNPAAELASKRLTFQRYIESEHIHVSSRRFGYGHVDLALNELGKKRNIALRVQHYLIAAHVGAQSEMLWTVPRALASQMPLTVKKLPFEVELMACQLYWHNSAHEDPASVWMRAKLGEVVSGLN